MILVCEPQRWGMEHAPLNASFLAAIRLAFPNEAVTFLSEESHENSVKKQIGKELASSITWKTITIPPKFSPFLKRFTSDYKLIKYILNKLTKLPQSRLLLTSGPPALLWALRLRIGSIDKHRKVNVIIHGELASLQERGSRNPFVRIQGVRTALKVSNDRRIQYILLEEPIRKVVSQEFPFLRDRIAVIEHPIPLGEGSSVMGHLDLPIQFGFLGLATKEKGFSRFLEFASELTNRLPGVTDFHLIGRLHSKYKNNHKRELSFLGTKPSTQRLSRTEYVQRLNKLHFICLPFQGRHYEFSASGTLLDCIAWEKPIIAGHFPIFDYLQRRFGDIGYFCKDDEFIQTIANIATHFEPTRYKQQIQNIRRLKTSRTPEAISIKFRQLWQL